MSARGAGGRKDQECIRARLDPSLSVADEGGVHRESTLGGGTGIYRLISVCSL